MLHISLSRIASYILLLVNVYIKTTERNEDTDPSHTSSFFILELTDNDTSGYESGEDH